jgi:eukaryotic-like serine/threonine-protein kinase
MTCSFCHTPLPGQSRYCMACGADVSDPHGGEAQRAALKELFDSLKVAVEGRYRVTDMLGRGGMGAVFLAEDLRLGRRVALKVLRPELAEDQEFVHRFEREARNAAGLDHPNIVPLYSVEQVGRFHYFTMKYVNGKPLDEVLADEPLPADQARRILTQAAAGLGHAHQRGVIHRDVKPQNLMLDDSGRVLITDFGISKALQAETQYTSTGQMVGTPNYLSPEQAQSLPVDGRSDQYSLACVGYRMVVGHLPLTADSVHALLYKHIHVTPARARDARPGVPDDLSDALERALAKDPAHRFPSMEEFAAAVSGESGAQGMPRRSPPPRLAGRRRVLALAAAIAALVIGVVGVALWHADQPESADISVTPPAAPSAASDTAPAAITVPPPPAPPPPAVADTTPNRTAKPSEPKRRPPARPSKTARAGPPTPATMVQPPPGSGYLTVNSVPYGTVSIDGVEAGDTPVVGRELPPGQHKVRITREGFRPETTTVTITAGNEVRLSRTLVPGP